MRDESLARRIKSAFETLSNARKAMTKRASRPGEPSARELWREAVRAAAAMTDDPDTRALILESTETNERL